MTRGLNIDYYLYLARCENGYLKIGISTEPVARVASLKSVWKTPVILLDSFLSNHKMERILHASLSAFRIKGEWYRDDPQVETAFALVKAGRIEELGVADAAFLTRKNTILKPDQVREIRRRGATGEHPNSIAQDFQVGRTCVWMIVHRYSWKHID